MAYTLKSDLYVVCREWKTALEHPVSTAVGGGWYDKDGGIVDRQAHTVFTKQNVILRSQLITWRTSSQSSFTYIIGCKTL